MKLLVFAHVPPPFHGQSFMVGQLLEVLQDNGGDEHPEQCIQVFHVDSRLSNDVDEIARVSIRKLCRLLGYCLRAMWLRVRHGVRHFYYVPAPGLRAAVYRDWIVMALCRPFFSNIIYHYQAAGVGEWLEDRATSWERWISLLLLGRPALSIALGDFYHVDAEKLSPRRMVTIPNCAPDPCPDFESKLLPKRKDRAATLRKWMTHTEGSEATRVETYDVLFLSLCYRPKGLFDAVEAIALFNANLRACGRPLVARLHVAGKFYLAEEQREFEERIAQPDLSDDKTRLVHYHGFADETEKRRLFERSDCFLMPSYYPMEAHPVSLVEAMAYGLNVIATRWRILPELFPPDYPGLADPESPVQIAEKLEVFAGQYHGEALRERYLQRFTRAAFGEKIRKILLTLEDSAR